MGNQLKISQAYNQFKAQNAYHTYDQLRQKTSLINQTFRQNNKKLGFTIQLLNSSIRYENFNWRKSTIKGLIRIQHKKNQQHSQMGYKNQERQTIKEDIILSYEDINAIYIYMVNIQQAKRNSKDLTDTMNEQRISQIITPIQTPMGEGNQCCICFEKVPSMVLPCSHAFCDQCTIKYIVETQQKKCPQCRHQFKGSRQSVQKQIYTLIQQDQQVFEQIKFDILHVLKNLNSRVARNIQEYLKVK